MSWTNIYPFAASDPVERRDWTRAIIVNRLYLYRVGLANVLRADVITTPGTIIIEELEPAVDGTPLTIAGAIQGVFNARGRLGMWDITGSIYWSAPIAIADDAEDFTPSEETSANVKKVDAVKGAIVQIFGTDDGFVIYSTSNIVRANYIGGTEVFRFTEISNNLGIFSKDHVCIGENGLHVVWANNNLYKINANANPGTPTIEPYYPELSDYILQHQGYPKLSHHRNRYLAISLGPRDIKEGTTIIQKIRIPGENYFRDEIIDSFKLIYPGYPEQVIKLLRGGDPVIIPAEDIEPPSEACYEEGGDPQEIDGVAPLTQTPVTSFQPQPVLPPRCEQHILWAAITQIRPFEWQFVKKSADISMSVFVDDLHSDKVWITFVPITIEWIELTEECIVAIKATSDYIQTATGIAIQWPNTTPGFSFNPLSFMYQQARAWHAEHNSNNEAVFGLFEDFDSGYGTGLLHELVSVATEVVSTEADPDPQPGLGCRYWVERSADTENHYVYVYRELRESGIITTYRRTVTYKLEPDVLSTVNPRTFSTDGGPQNITSGGYTADYTFNITYGDAGSGYDLLFNEQHNSLMSHLTPFNSFVMEGLDETSYAPISRLAIPYDDNQSYNNYHHWLTSSSIVGVTDMCSYAVVARSAGQRAAIREFTQQLKFGFIYVDVDEFGADTARVQARGRMVMDYNFRITEGYFTNDPLSNSMSPTWASVPNAGELQIRPLASLTKANTSASPNAFLAQYLSAAKSITYADYLATNGLYNTLLKVYADNGWLVNAKPLPVYPAVPKQPTAGPRWNDNVNGTTNAGLFTEIINKGTICGKNPLAAEPIVDPQPTPYDEFIYVIPGEDPVEVFYTYITPGFNIQNPDVITFEGYSQRGAIYPTYSRALIHDTHLNKWGSCDLDFRHFLDYRPVNATAYDPVKEELTTAFTYDNFLSALGCVLPQGRLVLFDRVPDLAFVLFGKMGYKRKLLTRLLEAEVEFVDKAEAIVAIESSIDGKLINPYTLELFRISDAASKRVYPDVQAQWFNYRIIGGRFEIIGFEFNGVPAGRRP